MAANSQHASHFSKNDTRTFIHRHDGDVHISEATYEHIGYFAAGDVASITSRTATAPLDRIKIYLIAQTAGYSSTALSLVRRGRLLQASGVGLKNFGVACRSIWEVEGLSSYWAGNGLNVVKMLPEGAIKFGTYETAKRFFASWEGVENPEQISVWAQTASGGLGGVAAQFAAYPIDTARFRMQCEMHKGGVYGTKLMRQTAQNMLRTGGVRAYFRGLLWGLIGQYSYSAIDLTTFECTKRW